MTSLQKNRETHGEREIQSAGDVGNTEVRSQILYIWGVAAAAVVVVANVCIWWMLYVLVIALED